VIATTRERSESLQVRHFKGFGAFHRSVMGASFLFLCIFILRIFMHVFMPQFSPSNISSNIMLYMPLAHVIIPYASSAVNSLFCSSGFRFIWLITLSKALFSSFTDPE